MTLFVTSKSYRYFDIIFYYWYYFAETSTIGNGDYYSLVRKKVRPFSLVWFETSTVLKYHFSTVAIRKFQMETKSANITVPLLLEQKKRIELNISARAVEQTLLWTWVNYKNILILFRPMSKYSININIKIHPSLKYEGLPYLLKYLTTFFDVKHYLHLLYLTYSNKSIK